MRLYDSGDLFLPQAWRDFLSTPLVGNYDTFIYVTGWSFMHLLSGVLFGSFAVYNQIKHPYWVGLALHTIWECWQILIGMNKPWNLTGHNGFVDIVVDTLFFMGGLAMVITFNQK